RSDIGLSGRGRGGVCNVGHDRSIRWHRGSVSGERQRRDLLSFAGRRPGGVPLLFLKEHFQRQCIVVVGIAGAVYQRQGAAIASVEQCFQFFAMFLQLGVITLTETFPALGFVTKPLAHLGRGRKGFAPFFNGEFLLLHPSWPEAINQYTVTITGRWIVVKAFAANFCWGLGV